MPISRKRPRAFLITMALVIGSATLSALFFSYYYFQDRFLDEVQSEAHSRSVLIAGAIKGDTQRNSITSRILSRSNAVIASFSEENPALNDQFALIAEDLEGQPVVTMGWDGVVLHSSDPELVGRQFLDPVLARLAIADSSIALIDLENERFIFANRVESNRDGVNTPLGLVAVPLDFSLYRSLWQALDLDIYLSDSQDRVLASTDMEDTGKALPDVIGDDHIADPADDNHFYYIGKNAKVRIETLVGYRGWTINYFAPANDASEKLQTVLFIVLFIAALAFTFSIILVNRTTSRANKQLIRETAALRRLNQRLVDEIESRQKAEASLELAEQSLEHSSKLAAIGQMSTAIGHELNQPLAAMRTYLAGSKMLLRRNRFIEAVNSLNRIEDLLERMGSITRQLRSFARERDSANERFDLRDVITDSLAIMAPQIGQLHISVQQNVPDFPVYVRGNKVRTDQIIVNLLRNAVDAVKSCDSGNVIISIDSSTPFAWISVADNGTGIVDTAKLFEPFYTTKPSGEGLGLGLAISAGYAKDMGGKLTGHNQETGGAIFTLQLPVESDTNA